MKPITWIYRHYRNLLPFFRGVRGATYLKTVLRRQALKEHCEGKEVYTFRYNGVDIALPELRYFEEMCLDANMLYGYTKKREIHSGDVVVDAGAFPGEFTVYASKKVGNEGLVIALEPDPSNLDVLRETVELNELENVVLLEKALWSNSKTLTLEHRGLASHLEENGAIPTNSTTLDRLYGKFGQVDFVKMDIEGAEIRAIEGSEWLIKEEHPYFAIASYHKDLDDGKETAPQLEKIFSQMEYQVETGFPKHRTTWAFNR